MTRIITGLARMTELEAINGMLAAIGESPVLQAEIESPTQADVTMAIDILTDTHREVLSMGWKFNTEFGFEIAPDDTHPWTGSDGDTATLNIFLVPATLMAFELARTSEQIGLDTEAIPPRDYSASEGTLVFYDRAKNRDGFDSSDFDYLYIDAVFSRDFEDTPETFRRYVAIKAARRFQSRVLGSPQLDAQTGQDEVLALRNLKREQGLTEELNIFFNADTQRHLGTEYRRYYRAGFVDNRNSPRD
jgi:hypothetical protein